MFWRNDYVFITLCVCWDALMSVVAFPSMPSRLHNTQRVSPEEPWIWTGTMLSSSPRSFHPEQSAATEIQTTHHGDDTFRITIPLRGESTGHRWIPLTQGQ